MNNQIIKNNNKLRIKKKKNKFRINKKKKNKFHQLIQWFKNQKQKNFKHHHFLWNKKIKNILKQIIHNLVKEIFQWKKWLKIQLNNHLIIRAKLIIHKVNLE